MSADFKMLELAAKAAGLPWDQWVIDGDDSWNPLTNDGDALRLAVRLHITVKYYRNAPPELGLPRECAVAIPDEGLRWFAESGMDPYAATRRAIVRAAAEIGQGIAQPPGPADLPEDNYYKSQAEAEEVGRAAAGEATP